ncbi:hypothetical protein GTP46_27980 [Duganella sp. FT135W]|uniref:Uncharacterized protein n=1 Tax=Duganella flavida TaxID=2692175 RepID=A0A6L8KL01_9BURK|nr:hypothetical protein [Duganella flavida]MYM26472.1 hypothetical protein [Duganella flavida]
MIELFPDNKIPVTWENVIAHSKKKFGHGFNRQILAQKEWGGRKVVAEAFSEAKNVQRRMHNDTAPKYRNAARAVLQRRIAELEAKNLALVEELEKVRAQKVDEMDVFLNTPRDLRKLIEDYAVNEFGLIRPAIVDEMKSKRATKELVTSAPPHTI